ncbi:MAG: glycosyltransferase family 39 protein [Cyanobacteria bacterium REEB459]|nr:glycosyltransferase family 39 protein [Cyanobacteria bacterium REEB459]
MAEPLSKATLAALFSSSLGRWGGRGLLIFLGLRLIFWGLVFPNPDEAYYWLWGQHPGLSYYDHPPFQSWIQGLCTAVLGRSILVLRLPNLISNGILAATFYRLGAYLYGAQQARHRFWLLMLLVACSPLFFLFLALAWPDHWLITFTVLSSFYFVRFADSYRMGAPVCYTQLFASALFLGLAGLCKYTAVVVGLGFLATLLSYPGLRRLFFDVRLYLALALLLLVLLPVGLWNWHHDFYSFRFYGDRASLGSARSINWLQPLAFLALSAMILGPVHSWGLVERRLWRSPPEFEGQPGSVYGTLALWVFGLATGGFTLLCLWAPVLYYWNIIAYPLLFPLLADWFYRPDASPDPASPPWRRPRLLALAQGLGIGVVTVLLAHYTVLPLTSLVGPSDRDSAALYGWPQIAARVRARASHLNHPLLFTTDYRSAAALAYSLNRPDVIALSGRIDQFDFWYHSQSLEGQDAVLLGEDWHPICPAHLAMFDHVSPVARFTVRGFGRGLQTYQLVQGYGFKAGPPGYPLQPDYPLAVSRDGESCG